MDFQPASPSSHYISSSTLSLTILAVFESEIPIPDSAALVLLRDHFLPINPRFSSILVGDDEEKGWKRVQVRLEEHVKVPCFPPGLSPQEYDVHLQDYLSKVALEQLPNDRPLWEVHIITYPTSDAPGTFVFKLHHALGDGFSLMGALFSCLRRADDPSLPLTFPSSSATKTAAATASKKSYVRTCSKKASSVAVGCWYTVSDLVSSVLHSTLLEDDRTAVRSGVPRVEFEPVSISTVTFSLSRIVEIKLKAVGVSSVPETKTCRHPYVQFMLESIECGLGTIFYGIQLYKQRMMGSKRSGNFTERTTALVLLNTRMVKSYQSVEDMLKKNTWGNHFTFLRVPIPSNSKDPHHENPLAFIAKAKKIIKRQRNSLAIYLTGILLETMRRIRGHEAVSRYIHSTLKKSSTTISHMVGPMEKMAIAGYPLKGLYFAVLGSPQGESLQLTVVGYNGNLRIMVSAQKGFIDSQLIVSCIKEAYQNMYREACGKELSESQ
ncbi:hypothetical protein ACLOJK_013616 [Asimina triloba]